MWWDQQGVVYYELLQPAKTVIAQHQQQLIHASDALEEKSPFIGKGRRKVHLDSG